MDVEVRRLGLVEYGAAWDLQRSLAKDVTPERGFLLLPERGEAARKQHENEYR